MMADNVFGMAVSQVTEEKKWEGERERERKE
jgi:hypothetical protein